MKLDVNIHRQQGRVPTFLMTSPDISSSPPSGQSFNLHNSYRKLNLHIVMKLIHYIHAKQRQKTFPFWHSLRFLLHAIRPEDLVCRRHIRANGLTSTKYPIGSFDPKDISFKTNLIFLCHSFYPLWITTEASCWSFVYCKVLIRAAGKKLAFIMSE